MATVTRAIRPTARMRPTQLRNSAPITDGIAIDPARGSRRSGDARDGRRRQFGVGVADTARVPSLAIIAFQIGYTVLDGVEYPQTFARTGPLHIASMSFGAGCARRDAVAASRCGTGAQSRCISFRRLLASTASIAVVDRDSDVLVASIVLFFFGAGDLASVEPALPGGARGERSDRVAGVLDRKPRTRIRALGSPGLVLERGAVVADELRSIASAIGGNWPSNSRRWPRTIVC